MNRHTETTARMAKCSRTFTRALDIMRPLQEEQKRVLLLSTQGELEWLLNALKDECTVEVVRTPEDFCAAIEQQAIYAAIVDLSGSGCPCDQIRHRGFTKVALVPKLPDAEELDRISGVYDFWISEDAPQLHATSNGFHE